MPNPYTQLPKDRFWRSAVAERTIFGLENLYTRKFDITRTDKVAAAGSCFAQHVTRNLKQRGFNVLDVEPAPSFLPKQMAKEQGYGLYSARYGNIYTVRQFLQLLNDARDGRVREEDFTLVGGRYIDLLRPNACGRGFDSLPEAVEARSEHLERVRQLFGSAELVVFTLGLTEGWVNSSTGTVYPLCPYTVAEDLPPAYEFHNFTFGEILDDLIAARTHLQGISPGVRMLLTTSPVPLTATASDRHVMVANSYSKSVLRAVCGEMEQRFSDVDYFPSYEVITAATSRGVFYEANMRSVSPTGVDLAMKIFFEQHDRTPRPVESAAPGPAADPDPRRTTQAEMDEEEVSCDEVLLESFSR
ncbi:MAG TPA: GSCFA domain-containing protein [Caulobacteraceae bacterium]|jgi:hypothetical protein